MYYLVAKNQPIALTADNEDDDDWIGVPVLAVSQGLRIAASAADIEVFVRARLTEQHHDIERRDADETGSTFRLTFWERIFGPDIEPAFVTCGGMRLTEYGTHTEIERVWVSPPENAGVVVSDREKFLQVHTKRLEELCARISEHFTGSTLNEAPYAQVKSRPGKEVNSKVKSLDDYSVDFLLQFEKGKTPLEWLTFAVASVYIRNPDDPGATGWMGRFYTALLGVRDQVNALMRISPDAPGVAAFAQVFEKTYPMLAEGGATKPGKLRELAKRFIQDYQGLFDINNPRTAVENSKHFLDNASLLPPDGRATLEQIREMSLREASALILAKPLVAKWEKEFVSDRALPDVTQPAPLDTRKAGTRSLPEIEDPTDMRIWEFIRPDPSITDKQIAQRLNVTRQSVNFRRRSLAKMGYAVRVSRQRKASVKTK